MQESSVTTKDSASRSNFENSRSSQLSLWSESKVLSWENMELWDLWARLLGALHESRESLSSILDLTRSQIREAEREEAWALLLILFRTLASPFFNQLEVLRRLLGVPAVPYWRNKRIKRWFFWITFRENIPNLIWKNDNWWICPNLRSVPIVW